MITVDDEKKDGLLIHNAYYRCFFLNNETKNNDGSGVINLLIQTRKTTDYDCKKANHDAEMILEKRFEKRNDGLVVTINQIQTHNFSKKEDCKSAKTDDTCRKG